MSNGYSFVVMDETFSFKEVSHDLTNIDFSKIFAMIRLSGSVTLLSSIAEEACNEEVRWKCLKLEGEYDFNMFGILSNISKIFADARIPVMTFSDYRTGYFTVQKQHLAEAVESLKSNGNTVHIVKELSHEN